MPKATPGANEGSVVVVCEILLTMDGVAYADTVVLRFRDRSWVKLV